MKSITNIKMFPSVQKAIDEEVRRQIAEQVDGLGKNFLACYLWHLHVSCGYGKKRLIRAAEEMMVLLEELKKYYDFEGSETGFLCSLKLKDIGVNLDDLGLKMNIAPKLKGETK